MRILKFGGTSLANAECFLHVANIIENKIKNEQIGVVLSAPSKITNYLVTIVDETINQKINKPSLAKIELTFINLLSQINQRQKNFPYKKLKSMLDNKFIKLKNYLRGINLLQQCPDNIYAKIICSGEIISVAIMQGILESREHSVTIINPVKTLLGIGSYLNSTIDIIESKSRIQNISIAENDILIMSGFIAGNNHGELVVLGRNGSDYSAAVLSVCLQANYCEIWTDVDGVYTCDPRQVPDAKLLKYISYQEAMELSYFGAKVLHPKTISPIAQFQISCLIKNTAKPHAIGTLITDKNKDEKNFIKGITHLNNMAMFNVSGPGMKGMIGVAARVFSAMSKDKIWIVLITQSSSAYNISFCIPHHEINHARCVLEEEFRLELTNKLIEPIDIIENLAIISVIGSGMRTRRGISAKIFSALANTNINIIAIAQGSSESSISVVVSSTNVILGVQAVHQTLFNLNQEIEVFLIGTGGVGCMLLEQISHQKKQLKKQHIDIKICGIANTKKSLINIKGISLDNWLDKLQQSPNTFNIDEIINTVKTHHLCNPVIIDCSSDQKIANQYNIFLTNRFHIVTPNKKANTTNIEYYKKIRLNAIKYKRKFLYDTNVGAGLPVIENLQKLLQTGDELIYFKGILSGALSFIFGKLDAGVSFSQATQEAKDMGFTEPDPRDDLSGIDVARKLLILAREVGYEIELKDIEIESILPDSFKKITDIKQFLEKIKELDGYFYDRINKARNIGKVLRFIGI
ncbi:MAG TPA: bifunctional aspartate kinase/homoserine dehydrogenase I, partial [Buchnera sp. (in: enterobacteria)]|nr:bifunctional aspartate kinase/homoserine dehydrogenase I [Buchnera sp. (in: enterobacteria)]